MLVGALGTGVGSNASGATVDEKGKSQRPDTLDLANHAELAINGMLGGLNPGVDFETTFLTILDTNPQYMLHWSSMVSGVMPKFLEALPMLRLMTGSDTHRDLEQGMVTALVDNMADDGLVYDCATPRRPWNVGVTYGRKDWDEDYANIAGNGRLLAGCVYWHRVTGDPKWQARAKRTAERMLELAVEDGKYAFYPNPGLGNDFSYPRKSGWTTKKPPERPDEGFEGATLFYLCQPLRGFSQYATMSGDERFIDLSRKITAFALQERFWGTQDGLPSEASFRLGHFGGHFHGVLAALRGLLDYAVVSGDADTAQFVRDGYHFARERGSHRLGLCPRTGKLTEGCAIADMIGLAVALSDAGMGDYWDDVSSYTRNGLVSVQVTDAEELARVAAAGKQRSPNADWGGHFDGRFREGNRGVLAGQEIHDRVAERTLGQFGHLYGARYQIPQTMSCCTGNCSQALYYTWEGITRRHGELATVNLWMNRRSPWLDIASDLPYSGRLSLQNKGLRSVDVRVPGWISRQAVRCQINGRDVEPTWVGHHAVFSALEGHESIVLSSPLQPVDIVCPLTNLNAPLTDTERYRCLFKGDTAIRVALDPAATEEHAWYRVYQREGMLADRSPQTLMPAYVHPEKILQWQPV